MRLINSINRNALISVLIVTYNSANTIASCVTSFRKSLKRKDIELIVIDNNSSDSTRDSLRFLKRKKLIDKLYLRNINYGFAKSVNFGVSKAKGIYIITLNPDTHIDPDHLANFIDFSIKSQPRIVGPMMYGRDGKVERSYVRFPSFLTYVFDFTNIRKLFPNNHWHKRFYYLDRKIVNPSEVDAISGAFMFFPKEIHKNLGGFDEGFFMYLEDVDFCLRARLMLGVGCLYFPGTNIIHIAGASSGNKDRVHHSAWMKSRLRYVNKNEANLFFRHVTRFLFKLDDIFIKYKLRKYESGRC